MSLIVVMPCYQGGELFKKAYRSLINSGLKFDDLLVSFNGDQKDIEEWLDEELSLLRGKNILVLKRMDVLSAKDHLLLLSKHLEVTHKSTDMVFFLAHDDELKSCEKFSYENNMQVIFPTYEFFREHNNPIGIVASKFDWFIGSLTGDIDTNMSGMVVPVIVFRNVMEEMKNKVTGSRFENMMALNNSSNYITYSENINVIICARPDSDGAMISSNDSRDDEIKYCLYAWNHKNMSIMEKVVFCFYLIKKTCSMLVGKWLI